MQQTGSIATIASPNVSHARIAGVPAGLDEAISAAAVLLGQARAPLIAGLGTDHAGAVAAVALARRLGAVLDPMHADALRGELDAAAAGWIGTTQLVAHAEADAALLIGPGAHLAAGRHRRAVVALCPARGDGIEADETIPGRPAEAAATLGLLRALLAGRAVMLAASRRAALLRAAEALRAAKYGVVVWQSGALEPLAVEQAAGLVRDLNATARWGLLPIPPPDNALGVMAATVARCGAPFGVAFEPRGRARYDPWRNHAARLIDTGETDAVLWISAITAKASDLDPSSPAAGRRRADPVAGATSASPPAPAIAIPLIALVRPGTTFRAPPAVRIEVGCPGLDHDAVLHDPALGQLAAHRATAPSDAPRVADILHRILQALPC